MTTEQMKEQEAKENDMYLLLPPLVLSRVVVVNDLPTLQCAASALLPARSMDTDGRQKLFFVGVDAEWRAIVTHKSDKTKSAGASVLQVSNG